MTAGQSPYGGGGFPPPWMRDSTRPDDDSGLEWGDPSPSRESGYAASEPLDSPGEGDSPSEPGIPAVRDEDRPHDFDSILGAFSGAADTRPSPPRKSPSPEATPHRAREPRKERTPRARSQTAIPWRKALVPVVIVTATALVAGAGYAGYNALNGSPEPDAIAASSEPGTETVSRSAPPGWSQSVAWKTPADVASNLAVYGDHIAYLNTSGVLVVLDNGSGETVFSSTPTGADPGESRVALTQIEDAPVAAVIQEESVTAWALNGDAPEPKVNSIPSSASVSAEGSGIMMISNDETWRMNSSLGLEKVEGLAKESTSLGMTSDGSIISGSPKGGWSINNGAKSTEVTVEMVEGAEGEVMYPARASSGFVVAWAPTKDKNIRAVGLYNAQDGSAVATTTMPTTQVNLGLPLVVTNGGTLASAGTWLVDVERGETESVEGWSATIGTASELYGKTSEGMFVWRGSGAPEPVPDDAAIPWGATPEDKAVVISTDDNGGKVIAALDKES